MAGPRDTRRYTEHQIQAMCKAHFIDGHTPAEVVRMASAGTLGVPAFTIDRRYIYQLLHARREAFEAQQPEALARGTHTRLIRLHRLLEAQADKLDETSSAEEIARISKRLAESQRQIDSTTPPEPRRPEPANDQPADKPKPSVVTDLLTRANEGARASSRTRSLTRDSETPSASPDQAA